MWQADPLVQAQVLDPGLPPEQLLAPARGRTLRQRGYSLSKCNEHVGHTWLLVVYAYHSRFRFC
jgi:hypothetical protein